MHAEELVAAHLRDHGKKSLRNYQKEIVDKIQAEHRLTRKQAYAAVNKAMIFLGVAG